MKHTTRDIAVTALTGTTRLKSAYTVAQSNKHEFKQNLHIKITNNQHLKQTKCSLKSLRFVVMFFTLRKFVSW